MSVTALFHGDNFSAYDNIPTSWKDLAATGRDKLGNAIVPALEKDTFVRQVAHKGAQIVTEGQVAAETAASTAAQGAAAAAEGGAKTGIFKTLGTNLGKIGQAAVKHKGVTAVIAAAAVVIGGIVIHDVHKKNKLKKEHQIEQQAGHRAYSHQG